MFVKLFNIPDCGLKRHLSCSRLLRSHATKEFNFIPGPKSYPLVENLFSLKKYGGDLDLTFPNFLFELQRRYGNIVKFGIAKKPEVYVYDPESVEKVFMHNDNDPEKKLFEPWSMYFDVIKKPQSLNNSYGPRWRKLRSAINPALSRPQSVVKHISDQNKIANDMVDTIRAQLGDANQVIIENFEKKIRFLALEFVSQASFGKKLAAFDDRLRSKETDKFVETLNRFIYTMSVLMTAGPIWKYVSTKEWREFKQCADDMLKFIGTYIDEAFRNVQSEQDKYIVKYMHENKTKYEITDDDIQSTVAELFTGGLETVSSTMHFVLFKLASEKKYQDKIYAEIKQVLKPSKMVDDDVLNNVKYLKAFIKEVLRYYPIVLALGRFAKEDIVLHGYKIPKGTFINVISGVTSRLSSVYDNPDKFDPHRWLDTSKNYHRFGMVPFGYGMRNCVARRFSEQEMYITIIKMVENFELEYVGEKFGYTNSVFSGPDKSLRLKFTKRF